MYCWYSLQLIKTEFSTAAEDYVYSVAHETIESITDPLFPSTDAWADRQEGWTAPDPAMPYPAEVCERCARATVNGGQYSDGLIAPAYYDKITKKCVCPGSGLSPYNPDQSVTFTYKGGPLIMAPVLWLMFWGSGWNSLTTLKNNVITRVQQLVGADKVYWDTARVDYGNFAYPVYGGSIVYTGGTPANPQAYDDNDHYTVMADAIIDASLPDPLTNSRVTTNPLGSVTVSNIIYVTIPDPSWRFDPANPNAPVMAYHDVSSVYYPDATPPPPPPPPPNAPPPVPPSPPPPNTDASGNGWNTVDGFLSTAWSATGTPYVAFDLGFTLEVNQVKIDFMDGEKKVYFFDLDWSVDAATWNSITPSGGTATWRSDGTSTGFQTFTFPVAMAQYIRITGHGNNAGSGSTARNDTFAISEVQFWGPDVDMTIPPPPTGTGSPPTSGTGQGAWVWSGTEWVWTNTIPGGGSGTGTGSGGTGTGGDTGTTGPNIPVAPPPIITIYKDFVDSYNLAVETGDLCAAGNLPAVTPLAEIYNVPVTNMLIYFKLARAGGEVQRVGEAVVSDSSQLIGKAPRKVSVTLKRVGTCDGVVYCRIRDNKNKIMQELGDIPAGSITLNDTTCDFENDGAQYILKKGDVIWIEYDDASAVDGSTYIMYKAADKDAYDAINSMFVKYTTTTVPDPLTDFAAIISV